MICSTKGCGATGTIGRDIMMRATGRTVEGTNIPEYRAFCNECAIKDTKDKAYRKASRGD